MSAGPVVPPVTVSPVLVRPAREEELDAAGAVVAAAYRADALSSPDYLAVVADARARASTAQVLVAVDAGTVVGSVTLALAGSPWAQLARPGEAELRMLGVDPAARARGVGEALVRAAAQRAQDAGARRVVLSTADAMASAHRLYRRLGLVPDPALDWSPRPGMLLTGYAADLPLA